MKKTWGCAGKERKHDVLAIQAERSLGKKKLKWKSELGNGCDFRKILMCYNKDKSPHIILKVLLEILAGDQHASDLVCVSVCVCVWGIVLGIEDRMRLYRV